MRAENTVAGIGCFAMVAYLALWGSIAGAVVYVAWHFIKKFW